MRTGRFRSEAQQTTNIAHLSAGRLAGIEFPLPPLAEQKRIVAKVDELMRLIDDLEAKQAKKRETQTRLRTAALDALTSAEGPEEFEAAWNRVAENFGDLLERAEDVDGLRQTTIELAMRGALGTADVADAPVSDLLSQIDGDRRNHRMTKPVPDVGDDEIRFSIPDHWRWLRWGALVVATGSGWSPQCENHPRAKGEWGVLKVSAVSWFVFKGDENKALPKGLSPRPEFAVQHGDFLMSRANTAELVGRSVVVVEAPEHLMLSDKLVRCTFSRYAEKRFVNLFNMTAAARAHYLRHASGTSDSMKNISRDVILSMPVPFPPLEEQRRIVAKVDHLIKLCDDLEAKFRRAERTAAKLVEAVVNEMVA